MIVFNFNFSYTNLDAIQGLPVTKHTICPSFVALLIPLIVNGWIVLSTLEDNNVPSKSIANKYFLDSLPTSLKYTFNGVKFLFTHGSPNKINEYLFEDSPNTIETINKLESDVLVCAHTHIPYAKKYEDKLLINVGSIGKPKIGKPNPTYAIIEVEDNEEVKVTFRYLEYEFKRIVKDCAILKFPSEITSSYETGKE